MLYPTHTIAGALAGLWAAGAVGLTPQQAGVAALAGAVAGVLPDLDHPQSFAWGRVPVGRLVARAATVATPHRTATHSIVGCLAFGLLLQALIGWVGVPPVWAPALWVGAVAGWASHTFIDCLNPEGAQLLWPAGPRLSMARVLPWPLTFPTGSRMELMVLRPVLAVLLGLAVLRYFPV